MKIHLFWILVLPSLAVPPVTRAAECRDLTFRAASFTACTVDLRNDDLRLHWRDSATKEPFATFGALRGWLARRGRRMEFATNAGIYAPGYVPLGLYVENGRTLVPLNLGRGGGNFFLKPNGVFFVGDRRAGIVESSRYARLRGRVRLATQSGPLLLSDGRIHPAFRAGSANVNLRSGVGVVTPSKVVFAISEDPVNFNDFALLFRDALHCSSALYLDGTISRMYDRPLNRLDTGGDFAGIFSVETPLPHAAKGRRVARPRK